MTTDKKYTLIAYKPCSSRWEGCHCHGNDIHFDADFHIDQDLTEEELKQHLTRYAARELDKGEDPYEFLVFEGGMLVLAEGKSLFATIYDATEDESRYGDENDLKNLTKEQKERDERMQRIFAESAAKVAAEKEANAKAEAERAETARKLEQERARQYQEEQERQQFERLRTKFGTK